MPQRTAARGARNLIARQTLAHPARFSQVQPLRLRNAPMLLLALCFAAGILCRGWWQPFANMVVTCALLLLAALLAWLRAPRLAWGAASLVWIALGWAAASVEPAPQENAVLPYADMLQRTVQGHVAAVRVLDATPPPQENTSERGTDEENIFAAIEPKRVAVFSLDLNVEAIEYLTPDISRMQPVNGGIRVTVYARPGARIAAPECGADLSLTVRLHPPQRYVDPGVFQYAELLAARGIQVQGTAEAATLQRSGPTIRNIACRLATAQHWSSARLVQLAANPAWQHLPAMLRLNATDTAMLSAMLFGDRTRLTGDMRVAFERTGSFHLFVVAGMHVALFLAILYGGMLRVRVPRLMAAPVALTLTAGYAVLTGFGEPVQRALLMSAVYLFALLLARGRNVLNALGAAALAMLLLRPSALFDSSFQMTLLAIVAIGGIAQPLWQRTFGPYRAALRELGYVRLDPHLQPHLAQFRVALRWLGETNAWLGRIATALLKAALLVAELSLVGLCSEVVMSLPMAIYFHRATPFGVPANLAAVPLVGLLMSCAIATFLAALVHPVLALVPGAITAGLLHAVTAVIGTISSLRGADIRMPQPLLACIVAALVCWFVLVYLLRAPAVRVARAACLLLPLSLLLVLWPRRPALHRGALEFTAIDVGQGDSLFVASPTGSTMLIDAGGPTGSANAALPTTFNIGEQVVSPYLWTRGVRRLDILALTHAHTDHLGGMDAVLRNFRPRELWLSLDADTPAFHELLRDAAIYHVTVRHMQSGAALPWGGTSVRVLSPAATYRPRAEPVNDDSLVLRIAYGKSSVLAEGDAERPSEMQLAQQVEGPVTLLKVGHHGSNTSTTQELLSAAKPGAAIISCGRGNRFGHPRMPVLQRLQSAGVRTSRTDEMGAVQYLLHADGSLDTHVLNAQPEYAPAE